MLDKKEASKLLKELETLGPHELSNWNIKAQTFLTFNLINEMNEKNRNSVTSVPSVAKEGN